jgi:hypothetical protein
VAGVVLTFLRLIPLSASIALSSCCGPLYALVAVFFLYYVDTLYVPAPIYLVAPFGDEAVKIINAS